MSYNMNKYYISLYMYIYILCYIKYYIFMSPIYLFDTF